MERQALTSLAGRYRDEVPAKRIELAQADFKQLKDAAVKVLERAPGDISKGLLASAQFNDIWLLKTLVTHGAALRMVESKYPSKK